MSLPTDCDSNKPHYVIIGAGISGLSLAWTLKQQLADQIEITVIEKQSRVGGWIQTIEKSGFLFEQGPRSCRSSEAALSTLQLIQELELEDQVLLANPVAKTRYLYERQKLQKVPTSLADIVTSPLLKGLRGAILKEIFRPSHAGKEETIYQFFSRRFHSTLADRFVDPVVSGIYAGDIHRLSLKECFPFLHELEQSHGSILKGMLFGKKSSKNYDNDFIHNVMRSPLFSLKNGMETIPKALFQKLSSHIQLNTTVTNCESLNEKLCLTLSNGNQLEADHVFSTVPISALCSLFPNLSSTMPEIPYASIVVINVGYKKNVLQNTGFGYLVPSKEHEDILGVVWDSCVFPEQNRHTEETRLTVMMGGMSRPNLCELSEEKLIDIALNSLHSHLGIQSKPDAIAIKVCRHAIPQYILGHTQRIEQLRKLLPPRLHLCGPLVQGIGVNDCIANAKHIIK